MHSLGSFLFFWYKKLEFLKTYVNLKGIIFEKYMKKILLKLLSELAKKVINKHKPLVIWITWTVGKTTTTKFVSDFLKNVYGNQVYFSSNHYNWEFWMPLTILLVENSPWKDLLAWLKVFLNWLFLLVKKNYPKYIILEYWVDTPWEMDFMLNIAKPDYWIILNIYPNHIENFWSFEAYRDEKLKFAQASKNLIFNLDNLEWLKDLNKKMIYYWMNESASVYVSEILSTHEKLSFNIHYREEQIPLEYYILGNHQVYNIMPVFALWIFLEIDLETIRSSLEWVDLPKWRWNILKWIWESIILDGSYNWWLEAMKSGVEYISSIEEDMYKMLFLWDMRELWQETENSHLEIAHTILNWNIDFIFLVWPEMKKYVYEELKEKFENKIFWFQTSHEAGLNIRELLINLEDKKSIIFVKWSQNTIFLEEGIKEFLFDIKDKDKLCRQSQSWLTKKEFFYNNII